eukprot:Hpha_TRINITY_DN15995_c0_g1::TRINITY_DN15995_c0_g1_i2::g.73846::m.73846
MCVRLIHTTHNNMSRGATLAEPLLASSAGEDTIPAPGTSSSGFVSPVLPGSGAGLGATSLLSKPTKPLLGPRSGAAASFKPSRFKAPSQPGASSSVASGLVPSLIPGSGAGLGQTNLLSQPLLQPSSRAAVSKAPSPPGTSSSVGSGLVPSLIQGSGAGLGPANLLSKPLLGPSSGAAASFKSPNFKTSSPPGTSRTAGSDLIPSQIPFGPVSAPGYAGSPLKPSSARSVQAKGAGSIPRSTVSKAKENKVIEQTRDMGSSARAMQRDTLRLLQSAECSSAPAQIEMDLKMLLHAPVPWGMSKEEYDRCRQQKLNKLCSTPHFMHLLKEFAGRFDSCLELIEKRKQSGHTVEAKSHDAAAAKAEDFAELMELSPRNRKVCFWDADKSAEPMKLFEWIYTLPEVKPSLGYLPHHISTILLTQIEYAVKRERANIAGMLKEAEGAAGVQVTDWVVALALEGAERGFELFLAGV